jgi:acetylornithine deacetylase
MRDCEWAQRLVRFNTVSHQSNQPLIDTIADHLRTPGRAEPAPDLRRRSPQGQPVRHAGRGQARRRDPVGPHRHRALGRAGLDRGPAGPQRARRPAVRPRQRRHEGLHRPVRGAGRAFLEADLPFAVHFAFSYDEEVGGFGVRHLIADLRDAGLAPTLCIVGEPTGMVPALAHKGVHRWRCCVKGAAHSSLTPKAVNAIEAGARVVAHIADMADRWRAEGPFRPGFDVPFTTAAVGVVEGGIADNVVPEDCRFHYEFRDLPGTDVEACSASVLARARALEPAMHAVDPATGFRFETICARCPPSEAAPDEPAVRAGAGPGGHAGHHAGGLRHRGRAVPARRHLHRGLRPGLHRPGAPGRRVRQLLAAAGRAARRQGSPSWSVARLRASKQRCMRWRFRRATGWRPPRRRRARPAARCRGRRSARTRRCGRPCPSPRSGR